MEIKVQQRHQVAISYVLENNDLPDYVRDALSDLRTRIETEIDYHKETSCIKCGNTGTNIDVVQTAGTSRVLFRCDCCRYVCTAERPGAV